MPERKASTPPRTWTFDPNESNAERHARRKAVAMSIVPKVIKWTIKVGIDLQIANHGHHWIFKPLDESKRRADWWPSAAKLVIDREFQNPIHCYDPGQVARELVKLWNLKGTS